MGVDEHTITLDDTPVHYLSESALRPGTVTPVYVHGLPAGAGEWRALLERTGGVAPDLLGFGRSGKGGHLEYSARSEAGFLARLLDELGLERVELVAHGWGVAAAIGVAAAEPARIRRVALISPAPLLPGQPWSRSARVLRTPVLGELAMGAIGRGGFTRILRRAAVRPEAWPADRVRQVWEEFDQGTQRAILRLHRSWDEDQRTQLAAALAAVHVPALLVWGDSDPWSGPQVAEAYASRLPDARTERISGAGHWPWLDEPATIELVAGFLACA